jgi:hypothetical protein
MVRRRDRPAMVQNFPPRDDATGEPVEPNEHDLAMLTAKTERLAELRVRLANLSWFMGGKVDAPPDCSDRRVRGCL